jgi:hypothetical protein
VNDGIAAVQRRGGGRRVGDVTDDMVAAVDADLLGAGCQSSRGPQGNLV